MLYGKIEQGTAVFLHFVLIFISHMGKGFGFRPRLKFLNVHKVFVLFNRHISVVLRLLLTFF